MRKKKDNKKKYLFSLSVVSIILFTIGLFALKAGEEFQVNTYTYKDQRNPVIAMDAKGNFIIAWESKGQDGSMYGVFAQRFNNKGKPIGSEFQVNTYTNASQGSQAVAMDAKGNFVITWRGGQDGSHGGICGQRYNRKGKAIGSEFQVNTYTKGIQASPSIAMDAEGNFIITWHSYQTDGSYVEVFAQRFNNKGKPIGSEFQVNTYTKFPQLEPSVAMDAKGNFVIAWESYGQDGSEDGIFAQRYNKKGKAIGSEFQVNTYTDDDQRNPTIAMDAKGNFVIAWESYGQDGSEDGIFAQRYNKKGKAIGSEFQVNTYTDDDQRNPTIAMDAKGNFIITWSSYRQDGSGDGTFAQRFKKNGQAIGTEYQINTYTNHNQHDSTVAMDAKGNFVITWESYGQDGSNDGIYAKSFKKN